MFGKNSLVADPLVMWSHCCCHFTMLAFLSFFMLYLTFWDFAVAYITTSGSLLSKFVSELISMVPGVCLYPSVFYVPVFFLQCNGLLFNFFYEMFSFFLCF